MIDMVSADSCFSHQAVCLTLGFEQGQVLSVEPLEHIHAALEENITSLLHHCISQGEAITMPWHARQYTRPLYLHCTLFRCAHTVSIHAHVQLLLPMTCLLL